MVRMKVLYISNYLDGTGWSHAAINNILSLDAVGIHVVPRAIKLNDIYGEIPLRIKELEEKNAKHPDVVIQHVLPHMCDYNGKISRNIILYANETRSFGQTIWPLKINRMNEAWVINSKSKLSSEESGIKIPIKVVPHATDITKFRQQYKILGFKSDNPDKFFFYTIGEINRRKNLRALLQAFHTEFAFGEPVELIIKTTPVGVKDSDDLRKFCQDVKKNLHLRSEASYKQESCIVEYWPESKIMQLHASADCFVCTSYGEAWSIPTFEAMAMGKAVICPSSTGFLDYMSQETGWMVPTHSEDCFGSPANSSRESWESIDIRQLRNAMREAYENRELRKIKSLAARRRAKDFTFEKVGNIMKGIIYEC